MNDQAIRFRFGIFVLASLILLAVLTILFGGFPNYFKPAALTLLPSVRRGIRRGFDARSASGNNASGRSW